MTVVEIQLNNRNRPMAHGPCTRVGLLVRFDRQRSFPGASHLPATQVASFKRGCAASLSLFFVLRASCFVLCSFFRASSG